MLLAACYLLLAICYSLTATRLSRATTRLSRAAARHSLAATRHRPYRAFLYERLDSFYETLEPEKLEQYLQYLREMADRRWVRLSDLQVLLGRMYRASLTMPHGSRVYLSELIAMMRGLRKPWHRRRMTKTARGDILAVISILESNHGRGYFDTSHLPWAPALYTDAMQEQKKAAWGWRFYPMRDEGKAVKAQFILSLRFKLN